MGFAPLTDSEERLARMIADAAFAVHSTWVLSRLKRSGRRLGFPVNFNVPLIKDGIKRVVL
jgi:hypothetical protein